MSNKSSIFERLFSLEGKTVLITGAAGGIGRVLAVALAEAGATIGLHDLTLELLEEPRRMVEEVGGKSVMLTADISEVEACRKLIVEAHAALGRLDVLINSAAINRRKPIEEVTQDDYDAIVAVNQRSIYFLNQAAHPIMRDQGGGKIINIGSINIFYALDTVSVYGLTKGAVAQMTKVMAVEWAADNIQVNCLAPGFVLTQLTAKPLWGDEKKSGWLRNRIPVRRPAQPEELVGTVLLLASEASSYISGQTFVVDGGVLAGGSWDRDPA